VILLLTIALLAHGPSPSGASVYVVRPDGSGDFPTIQAAIDAAIDGDTVELADGTFRGDGNRDPDYLGKAITVR
jgi:pectin methylesterase-like acyl-CoA thioesterase